MATVFSQYHAGKTLNVPHSEHRVVDDVVERERNAVSFDADGNAEVSERMAEALLEFYPRYVTIVKRGKDPKPSPVAKPKPVEDK